MTQNAGTAISMRNLPKTLEASAVPVVPNDRITEAGDLRITETGDTRITE